ncbi:MAG: LPS export ABC transporter periplasmic protein LptC [Balneolaceae bacterium]|nr:LPS export ABC transporter periplasmic protein LptC [Balneolaceae bacterium]
MARPSNIGIPFILLCIVPLITSCGDLSNRQTTYVEGALKDSLLSTTESWDFRMEIIEEGEKKVTIRGSHAENINVEDKKITRISGPVHIQVYDTAGAVHITANSNRAVYRSKEGIFELFGDVQVTTAEGNHLESEYLKWNQAKSIVSTDRFVILKTPDRRLTGTGFEGNTDWTSWSLENPSEMENREKEEAENE